MPKPNVLLTVMLGDWIGRLRELPDESAQMCVTSPPYFQLRDYGIDGQLGAEDTPEEYVDNLVRGFREVRRVLKKDGTVWVNLGDSFENKQLLGIPWKVAFALQADGWVLRCDIVWAKPNCMPESVLDRPTRSHEYIFLLSKQQQYYYDAEAIKEPASEHDWESRKGRANLNHKLIPTDKVNGIRPDVKYTPNGKDKQRGHSRRHDGFNDRWDAMEKSEQCSGMRNKRDVWTVSPANFPESHFATFPTKLIEPCILAGSKAGDVVLDCFAGSGTTGEVALTLGRKAMLIELNPDYIKMIEKRCTIQPGFPFAA